jgi:hypothetical protein
MIMSPMSPRRVTRWGGQSRSRPGPVDADRADELAAAEKRREHKGAEAEAPGELMFLGLLRGKIGQAADDQGPVMVEGGQMEIANADRRTRPRGGLRFFRRHAPLVGVRDRGAVRRDEEKRAGLGGGIEGGFFEGPGDGFVDPVESDVHEVGGNFGRQLLHAEALLQFLLHDDPVGDIGKNSESGDDLVASRMGAALARSQRMLPSRRFV